MGLSELVNGQLAQFHVAPETMKERKDAATDPMSADLLYRNQFVLGPRFLEEPSGWKKIQINGSQCITAHPDLNVHQGIEGNKSITLLGYVLDPDNPGLTNADIANNLVHNLSCRENFFERTFVFGGRWIMIINDGRGISLFHDAAGLRQVFYTDTRYTRQLWCASQPGLIAEALNLDMDNEAGKFIRSFGHENNEYWWPGDRSPYSEITHLLPNHYLDLETGLCKRYWPNKEVGKLPLDQAVEKISATLQGLLQSACERFDLALSLTAGWDSRLVLAASKGIRDRVSYMTVKSVNMPENHPDIQVPALLLRKLGLRHEVLKATETMDAGFEASYKKSVPFAHDVWAPDAQVIFCHYRHAKVAVTGSASEVGLKFRYLPTVARSDFAVKGLQEWLSAVGTIYDIDLDNMFYWEQRVGNWLAMCQAEFDSAWKDIFTPFNCRDLLLTILSVDEAMRRRPRHILYEKIMLNLWPEVLSVPINPHQTPGPMKAIKSLVRRELSGLRRLLGRTENAKKIESNSAVERFLSPYALCPFRDDDPKREGQCRK